ncbi:YvrJ family protein [Irregularibacter muris]|uniref:YvrJ family protein n=1 Tax=Irregularibacter muris TaxID=1796619 RepID=A0AAE3HEX8_9FIRM|nr:YvrJ family protein [Irregularibacter muris]MCR1898250.1 YvrJ family protein [Irregularibacter muris]
MEELLVQIGNFGFPMVISIYLLVRFEGKITNLTQSIYQLAKVIETMK